MKSFTLRRGLFTVFFLAALLVGVSNAWALDVEHATKTWNSLLEELNDASGDHNRNARSKYSIVVEGQVISGSDGLIFASREYVNGPLTKYELGLLAYKLYDGGSFALYNFDGYQLHVWFTGDYVSVVLLTAGLI